MSFLDTLYRLRTQNEKETFVIDVILEEYVEFKQLVVYYTFVTMETQWKFMVIGITTISTVRDATHFIMSNQRLIKLTI